MLTMHSKNQESNPKATREGELLKVMLSMLQSWQRKGSSPEEKLQAIERIYGLIRGRIGDKLDSSKLDLKHVFELLLGPKLGQAEKELIQALFMEMAHLKKGLTKGEDQRSTPAKNKNRYKNPVEKKFI